MVFALQRIQGLAVQSNETSKVPHVPGKLGALLEWLLPSELTRGLSRAEQQRLRMGTGACLVVAVPVTLYLPVALVLIRPPWKSMLVHIISVGLMLGGALAPRLLRARWFPRFVLGVWPAVALSMAMAFGSLHAMRYFVMLPLLAASFAGARLVLLSVGIAFAAVLCIEGPLTTTVPEEDLKQRMEVLFQTVMAAGVVLLLEGMRTRAENERDRAEEGRLALAREQLAREELQRAQQRLVRHQTLRADLGVALAEPGPLADCLQRCCEAMVRPLDAGAVRLWLLDEGSDEFVLTGLAGPFVARGELPGRVPMARRSPGSVAREKRPYVSQDVARDPLLPRYEWLQRSGATSFAGYPLTVGERLVGVLEVFAAEPLPEEAQTVIGAAADTIAHGIGRKRAEEALARHADELAHANGELARSNRELEQFAYVASHDLQEPLRMVASYTQLLRRRYQGKLDQDADEFITFAVDGVNRMKQLISDLLDFSRAGTRGVEPVPTLVSTALERSLLNLQASLRESGARVSHDPLPEVLADEGQLVQLFQNLIGNAFKFRQPDQPPRIHVSAKPLGDGWELSVKDNGIGIAPEYFERIFVLFQRLHTRNEYPGTGIGLALCKKIVERHGGRIRVESRQGEGSTFFFTLKAPLAPVERLAEGPSENAA